ncbi:MAG TPA: SDR family oxidoreductase [Bacteroidia bacterium]|nr:SDR family oxidoreductase [Bacteroidia bacterium]HRS59396.1 SDR family oxidoreductase [Bacteroidia bacterium]HRU68731.1 SDR family oxidoreductase [Bacteroidia bacterium]
MENKTKTCLITGATSGIGKAAATELARRGFHVIITYRNKEKALKVMDEIKQKSGNQSVEGFFVDFESLASVRDFAIEFKSKYDHLDVLINNAGIWETKRSETKDGIEKMFGVNHLAPFLLTNLLLDVLKKSAPARIVITASEAHRFSGIDFSDLESKNNFGTMKAYGQSKLANILFTKELSERLKDSGITVNCLHPGVVNTNLFEKFSPGMKKISSLFLISPEKGAETTVFLAASSEVEHISGEYFSKKKIKKSSKISYDKATAKKLWDVSMKYVKDYL